jgi:hypothetical protein
MVSDLLMNVVGLRRKIEDEDEETQEMAGDGEGGQPLNPAKRNLPARDSRPQSKVYTQ